eukprot:1191911-Prorocentrum_minimum.AAC.9
MTELLVIAIGCRRTRKRTLSGSRRQGATRVSRPLHIDPDAKGRLGYPAGARGQNVTLNKRNDVRLKASQVHCADVIRRRRVLGVRGSLLRFEEG